jgi:hypothetical protein
MYLSVVPSEQAIKRRVAGFQSGIALQLFCKPGETLHAIIDRLNEYRSPENQITDLYAAPDLKRKLPLSFVLYSDAEVWIA